MTDHIWMVDVLADLEKYAATNKLNNLHSLLSDLRTKAKEEIGNFAVRENLEPFKPAVSRLN